MPRSVAFSGKKKRKQLQQKRTQKTHSPPRSSILTESSGTFNESEVTEHNKQNVKTENRHEKFKLLFQREIDDLRA